MSIAFREKYGTEKVDKAEMRKWCQRPGKYDANGPIYFTEQTHKKECDINYIIKKYDKTGLISHVSQFEAKFGDLTGQDFKTMQDTVASAKSSFEVLPSEIRKQFDNSPEKLLTFMEDPENRDKAIELGLINKHWTAETDGLGEHVLEDQHQFADGYEPEPAENTK